MHALADLFQAPKIVKHQCQYPRLDGRQCRRRNSQVSLDGNGKYGCASHWTPFHMTREHHMRPNTVLVSRKETGKG